MEGHLHIAGGERVAIAHKHPGPAERASRFQALFADEEAFRAWYEQALQRVYSFVLVRCGGVVSDAMELTQETFVEATRSRMRYDGRADPVTWICGIARNTIADSYRRKRRDELRRFSPLHDETDEPEVSVPEPGGEVDAREAVFSALRSIPHSQGLVLALHYLDELPMREIARLIGRSESSVESLLSRGRESFRRAYSAAEVA